MKRHTAAEAGQGPFCRMFAADSVREGGDGVTLEANAAERDALARYLGLAAISGLTCDYTVSRRGRAQLEVSGDLRATVTQICVVSLEPFDTELREAVDGSFAPAPDAREVERRLAQAAKLAGSEGLMLSETPDPPDLIVNGLFDLGALTAEFLALGLDPYPRKPGAEFVDPAAPDGGEDAGKPFAALGGFGKMPPRGGKR